MPSNRNYRKEYDRYQKHKIGYRSSLNKANRKKGTYGNGDGKDVAHQNDNAKDNSSKNLKLESPSKNRSFSRTKTAKRKK